MSALWLPSRKGVLRQAGGADSAAISPDARNSNTRERHSHAIFAICWIASTAALHAATRTRVCRVPGVKREANNVPIKTAQR